MMPDCSETLCALRVRQPLARIGYRVVTRFGLTQVGSRLYSEQRNRGMDAASPQQNRGIPKTDHPSGLQKAGMPKKKEGEQNET